MSNLILLKSNDIDLQIYETVETYRDINQRLKKLKRDEDKIKEELSSGYFKNHNEFIYQGRLLLVYSDRQRSNIDTEKLESKYPKVFTDCQKITKYKQFDLK